jgi:hypothetical protein
MNPTPPDVLRTVEVIRQGCGDTVVAVIFFGSHLVGTSPGRHSAADLVLVVESYGAFYRQLRGVHPTRYGPWLLAAVNRILPPNIISLIAPESDGPGCKAIVITERDLASALSAHPADHFCMGRLTQTVRLVDARDEAARARIEETLAQARRTAVEWVPLYRQGPFTVRDFARTMLDTSYMAEIRPESGGRSAEVFRSQADYLIETYTAVLDEAVADGRLKRSGDHYECARPAGKIVRLRWRFYFWWSEVRATLRWFKYILTFDGWIDYLARKIERRTGLRVEVTEAERKWPFLLAWPKIFRVLLHLHHHRRVVAVSGKDSGR